MKSSFALLVATLFAASACTATTSSDGPVVDSLDVPTTATTLTVQGVTGPGVVVTLTAHDDDSGITALHAVFTETAQDQAISIPNHPTSLDNQVIELVAVGAPSGAHPIDFYLQDEKGRKSASIHKTITVP